MLRVAGLALLFLLIAPLHLGSKWFLGRSNWPRRFLGGAAYIVGARVRITGTPAKPHSLIAANHISWLDILVLAGATGCAFVSKDQLGHGFVHWLADQNHTIYVDRSARRDVAAQAANIGRALSGGAIVAFFPEGTVGPGDRLLPFRPPLFTAAEGAQAEVEIRPAAIDYGAAATEISWFGENGRDNVVRLLGRPGRLPVTVRLLEPLPHGDRKELARAAADSIAQSLRFKSGSGSPIASPE